MKGLYSRADVFLFPSEADTFEMSVLESQACGLPAVVSSVGGPREIIEDGVTGFVARAGDTAHWVSRVLEIVDMKNKDIRAFENMRKKSRERVLDCFDWESVYNHLFHCAEDELETAPSDSEHTHSAV
ncbi:MAG: glycosyltransferase [Candidatus Fermentibacteraceae bacterium]|nr:glycosyltransferase [Candidatus Fermentibacteraceae bacterium]MBN2607863.1 glycosyltransferase [Candidatus Fermentibacteraceae bacterium]